MSAPTKAIYKTVEPGEWGGCREDCVCVALQAVVSPLELRSPPFGGDVETVSFGLELSEQMYITLSF